MSAVKDHGKGERFPVRIRRGLAFKLILYVFLSIVVIFVLIFHYTLQVTSAIVVENLKSSAGNLTMHTVSRIESVLASIQRVPDNFAPLFEKEGISDEEIRKLLLQIVSRNHDITGACIAYEPWSKDPGRRYFAPYYFRSRDDSIVFMNLGHAGYDYFLMDWYQVPRELKKAVWSEPYFDSGGSDLILSTYSVPLFRGTGTDRRVFAILTVDISLDWLHRIMEEIRVYESGYGFIISQTGTIVTHPIREMIMNESIFSLADEQRSPDLRRIGRNMLRGECSFAEIEYHNTRTGQLSWIAYAPVSLNGWSIGVVLPVKEFMADVNRLRLMVAGFGTGGGVILIVIIVMISRSITRPLRRLTVATEAFASGDFNVVLPQAGSGDEISHLNNAFRCMQDQLAKTIADLQESGRKLAVSNEKLEEYNRTLEERVEERTASLKAAQDQLIQSEKMASLGQLTAGIAHEIKNPLNFVNNFSEVSLELISELQEEIGKFSTSMSPADLDYFNGLMADIGGNIQKINDHGKRADSIIRGMLLHSRGKSGEKLPTDVNALLGEYVNLGYHGLRATDSNFNIKIETDFDPAVGNVSVVPQDLSRVFLNMVNNACYSTILKKRELKDGYFPILRVTTRREGDSVIIRIYDNGKGIPPDLVKKVFNPFFTTKPAGSGTGLGLSISYDIITREHRGEIKVDTAEGEFAEFIITLPT